MLATTNVILAILTGAIVLAIIAASVYKAFKMVDERARREMEAEMRLRQVEEEMGRKRHTYPTLDGLFDAAALIVRARKEVELVDDILRTANMILGETSESPTSYKSETSQEWTVNLSDSGHNLKGRRTK